MQKTDVIVVGAGLSGLVAAREVARAGLSVRVLEARDRVGGRTYTKSIGGAPVDLGAHWLGPQQKRIAALVAELGITTHRQFTDGKVVTLLDGKRRLSRGALPPLPPHHLVDLALGLRGLEKLRRKLAPDTPACATYGQRWDAMTADTWKRRRFKTSGGRAIIDVSTRLLWGVEPCELSMLYFLHYINAGCGFEVLIANEGGAQQDALVGGTQQLSERLAQSLDLAVELSVPVQTIEQNADGVTVVSGQRSWQAKRVIIALAPTLAGRINYAPALPAARDMLTQSMPMGAYSKAVLVYDTPWWRAQGLSGIATANCGPIQMCVDDSPDGDGVGVLVAFITGGAARHMARLPQAQRQAQILAAAAELFGKQVHACSAFEYLNWIEEPYSRGATTGVMPPGVMSAYGHALRRPCGAIHWAGTETATEHTGYLDGAIQAGERAASEIVAQMHTSPG